MIKITIEQDGQEQTLEKFTCDQFYLLIGNDNKVTEKIFCEAPFLIYATRKIYEDTFKIIEDLANETEKEIIVTGNLEEVVNWKRKKTLNKTVKEVLVTGNPEGSVN